MQAPIVSTPIAANDSASPNLQGASAAGPNNGPANPLEAAFAELLAELSSSLPDTAPPIPDVVAPVAPAQQAAKPAATSATPSEKPPKPVQPEDVSPNWFQTTSFPVLLSQFPDPLPVSKDTSATSIPTHSETHIRVPFDASQPDFVVNSIKIQTESAPPLKPDFAVTVNPSPIPLMVQLKNGNSDPATAAETPLAVKAESRTMILLAGDRPILEIAQGAAAGQDSAPRDFQENRDREKQDAESNPKADTQTVFIPGDAPSRFDSHLAPPEPVREVAHVQEMPPIAPHQVAHKVSIDIGESESKVIVTLHERGGDVSVKVHAANDVLKTELQSSVGSLVQSLHRAQVSLANMDFTSGYGTAADANDGRNSQQQQNSQPRNRRRPSRPTDSTEDSVELSTVPGQS